MKFVFPVILEDHPIEGVKLSTRAYHICKRHKVNTIGDLVDVFKGKQDIDNWHGAGELTVKELKSALLNYMFDNAQNPDKYAKKVIELTAKSIEARGYAS